MRKSVVNLILFTFFWQTNLFAFVKPQRHRSKSDKHTKEISQKVIRPETYYDHKKVNINAAHKVTSIKRDLLNDTIRIVSGNFGTVQKTHTKLNHYQELALNFVAANFELFKLYPKDLKLIEKASYLGEDVQFIQFAVLRNRILIEDASVSFRFKQKTLVQIANYSFSEAALENETVLDQNLLEQHIFRVTGAKRFFKGSESFRVDQKEKNYVLKKISNYKIVDRDNLELSLQINQANSKIFELKDEKFYLHGQASSNLYPRWYDEDLTQTPMAYLDIKQSPSNSVVRTDLAGLFEVNESTTKLYVDGLKGQYVSIRNQTGTSVYGEGTKTENQWSLSLTQNPSESPWLNKTTAQYMVYHHVTKMLDHALNYIHPSWFDQALIANTNLRSTCNAHWDGRTINLYSGNSRCGNTGLIADVIYHEWGHGLDANTGGIQDSAFSEGIGDIMSLLITRSHLLGVGFMVADRAPVRNLEPNKIYPQDRGEVHAEGLIIGSTFWDLFEALSKKHNPDKAIDLMSQYILKGIYTARTYLDLYDAMLVIDDDDDDLENASPNTCLINQVFTDHGLAQTLNWCTLASVKNVQLQDENENGVLEPGESVQLFVKAYNPAPQVLENLIGTLSHEGEEIQIEQPQLEWNPIEAESSSVSSVPASFVINQDVACGSQVDLKLKLTADSREIFTESVFVIGQNDGTEEVHAASDLPQNIEDYETTTSFLQIDSPQWENDPKIHKAILKFFAKHTYVGDLVVSLVAPNGERFVVYKGNGGNDDVLFEKDITEKVSHIKAKGKWALEVKDNSFRDQGSLESFDLTLTPNRFVCDEESGDKEEG